VGWWVVVSVGRVGSGADLFRGSGLLGVGGEVLGLVSFGGGGLVRRGYGLGVRGFGGSETEGGGGGGVGGSFVAGGEGSWG